MVERLIVQTSRMCRVRFIPAIVILCIMSIIAFCVMGLVLEVEASGRSNVWEVSPKD